MMRPLSQRSGVRAGLKQGFGRGLSVQEVIHSTPPSELLSARDRILIGENDGNAGLRQRAQRAGPGGVHRAQMNPSTFSRRQLLLTWLSCSTWSRVVSIILMSYPSS